MPLRHNARSDNNDVRKAWHDNSLKFSSAIMRLQRAFHSYEMYEEPHPRFIHDLRVSNKIFRVLSNSYKNISVDGIQFDENYFGYLKDKFRKIIVTDDDTLLPSHFLTSCFVEEKVEDGAIVLRSIAQRTCDHMVKKIQAVLYTNGNEPPYLHDLVFTHAEVQIIALFVSVLSSGTEDKRLQRNIVQER